MIGSKPLLGDAEYVPSSDNFAIALSKLVRASNLEWVLSDIWIILGCTSLVLAHSNVAFLPLVSSNLGV